MGTRSLVHIKSEGKTLVTLYRQYDGYPEGMGKDIAEALGHTERCSEDSGYGGHEVAPKAFSGIGCASAYLIEKLKDGKIGNLYIMPADTADVGEEYTYTVYIEDNKLNMSIKKGKRKVFDGLISEFRKQKGEDNE